MRAELRALYFVSNVRREQSLQVQIFHMSDEGRASRLNYQTFSAEKVLKTDLTITRQNILQCINSSGNWKTWALQRYLCTVKIDDEMVQPPEFVCPLSEAKFCQILQVNTRWKALAEIYTMDSFAPFPPVKYLSKIVSSRC